MSVNRYLQGCDFTTLCLLRGRYATDNVEIQDFDGEQFTYELTAESHHEAAREAHELADADGIQISIMTIYEF